MKAMQLHSTAPIESNPLRLVDLPDPHPGPHEIRLRVHCCAICRTDLHVIEGDLPEALRPIIPGHQIVGTIDELGPNCSRLKLGQRAGAAWLRHTCGTCRYCQSHRENLCPNSQYTGYHANGGYAQFAIVPEDFAYELPAPLDDTHIAPLLCAGIIGYRALQRANLQPHSTLALYGFGSSAHIVLQLALHRGHTLLVVSRAPRHQQLARDLGAAWAGADAAQLPMRAQGAILFAPAGTLVPDALANLDPGSTLVLAGIHMSPIPSLDYQTHLYGERDIHPVAANTRDDARNLLAESLAANVRPHITTYPLAEANRALQDMKSDKINGTGVLIP